MKSPSKIRNLAALRTYFSGSFFIMASLVSAAINYAYYPVLARVLSESEFGASQALISLLSQASSVFAGLSLVTVYLVVKHGRKASIYTGVVQKIVLLAVLVIAATLLVMSPMVGDFLRITNMLDIALVLFALLTMVPFIIIFGYLVGHKRFITAACFQLVSVSLKLVIGTILALNFGVSGALLGIGLAQTIAVVAIWVASRYKQEMLAGYKIAGTFSLPSKKELSLLRPELINVGSLLVVSSCLVIFSSFDALIARNILGEGNGQYASASTLGTVVLFASLPLINLLMPYLNPVSIRSSIKPLARTTASILSIGALVCVAFVALPVFFLGIYGPAYVPIAPILWQFSLYMTLVAIVTLALQFLSFYRPLPGAIVAVAGTASLIASRGFIDPSPSGVLEVFAKVFAVILTVVVIYIGYNYIYERTSKKTPVYRRPDL